MGDAWGNDLLRGMRKIMMQAGRVKVEVKAAVEVKVAVEVKAAVEVELCDIAQDHVIEGAFEERAAELRAKHRKVGDDADAFLKKNEVIKEALGNIIFDEFIKIKKTELRQYETHVHSWERERYMKNF